MRPDFLAEARAGLSWVRALRRELHRRPELGNREERTSAAVAARLGELGLEVARPFGTAVVGTLKGALPGPAVALRADMDALPVDERTGCAFASEVPGVMHACGHDVHTAAALGAAALLSARREELPGTAVFLFEPDEEGTGGAAGLVEAGCLDGVGAVFGAHVDPSLPLGSVGVRPGKFYAASDTFSVTVRGKSCHGAQPERGIDALWTAASLVCALHDLPRLVAPERCVVTVGRLEGGTAGNVVCGEASFEGILRTLGADSRALLKDGLRRALDEAAGRSGATCELRLRESYGGVVNTEAETALARRAAEGLLGPGHVRRIAEPLMTTEDFGALIDAVGAGSFYHLGAGCAEPLHSAGFLPAEDAPVLGAAVHAAVLWEYLHDPC